MDNEDDVSVDVNERSRTYYFTSGNKLTLEDVVRIEGSIKSDTHVVYTGDGKRTSVSGEFDAVEVDDR